MRVFIKGQEVVFDDEKGSVIDITTSQLVDMFCILSNIVKEDNSILFKTIEFTV